MEGGRCLGGAVGELPELQELTLNFRRNELGWGPRKVAGPQGLVCGSRKGGTFQARSKVGGRMKAPLKGIPSKLEKGSEQDVE